MLTELEHTLTSAAAHSADQAADESAPALLGRRAARRATAAMLELFSEQLGVPERLRGTRQDLAVLSSLRAFDALDRPRGAPVSGATL